MNKTVFGGKNIYLYFIYICFIVLTLLICFHHEPWADEAQAWLIARDNTLSNIFFNICKSEGHPIGWFFILKMFIKAGLPYEYIFAVSCLFTYIGVWLLLFKTDLLLWVKTMFPFTYFPFYQYCVIARNYCLILPVFVGIGILYKKRFEHPILYCLLLVLSSLIHLYTMFVAGWLLLFFMIDILKRKETVKKIILYPILTSIFIAANIYFLFDPDMFTETFFVIDFDIIYERKLYHPPYFKFITEMLQNKGFMPCVDFANAMFLDVKYNTIIPQALQLLSGVVYFILIFSFYKLSKEWYKFLLITFSLSIAIYIVYDVALWHFGIITYTILLLIWIFVYKNEKYKTTNVIFKNILTVFLIFCFLIQIYYSVKTAVYDYKNNYTTAKDIASFLKSVGYQNKKIYGMSYKTVAICPYFETKFYDNYTKSFWYWKEAAVQNIELPDILIVNSDTKEDREEKRIFFLEEKLKENGYEVKIFDADMIFKSKTYEDNGYTLYIKPDGNL